MTVAKRTCNATTKAGKPCTRGVLEGSLVCLAHSDPESQAKMGFGGSQPGAGRPRKPHAIQALRDKIEADVEAVAAPLFAALTATKKVMVGEGDDARIIRVPDHQVRMAGARELLDRGYGKPRQDTTISGPAGGAIEFAGVDVLSDSKMMGELHDIRDRIASRRQSVAGESRPTG